MTTDSFLSSVAAYYAAGVSGRPSAETIVYVLPNKRSAMFLKKYVRGQVSGVAVMPRFMTMGNFISTFAARPEAPGRELIFILYKAYRQVLARHGRKDDGNSFDSFIHWGDMMLEDFDDIDRSLVNADELYRNLKDTKEIQADYLTDGQKEVIRTVWGESRLTEACSDFWMHVNHNGGEESPSGKFLYLWEILGEVYHEYHRLLKEKGVESPGGQFRSALFAVEALHDYDITRDTHYVFVGFNDLSTAETLIFEKLQRLGAASFFWDTAPLSLVAETPGHALPGSMTRLMRLAKAFPMPDDYELPLPEFQHEVYVNSVPSNIGQAKAISPVLREWAVKDCLDPANPINTALVLPDQNLLLPSLMSIPADIRAVNISMGMSYRTTNFASLLHSIVSMQLRARAIRGVTHFYYEDVKAVISQPHIQMVAGKYADAVGEYVSEYKLYNIPAADLMAEAPELASVFTPVHDLGDAQQVADYLIALFDWLEKLLAESTDKNLSEGFETKALAYFRDEVKALSALIGEYDVEMNDSTFFSLFERLFNSRGLTVNGTPLAGLQVLGVLETRALDFDNVIILSVNERVFPRKQYSRTMIPANLRAGFGLPDFNSLEWTYGYCFYRLLARAKRVELFYDARSEGVGNGEISRYISQLRYLMPSVKVNFRSHVYGTQSDTDVQISVPKSPEVMAQLERFKKGGDLRLSATALKSFRACPMKFYLEYVRRMRTGDELHDNLDASDYGTALHNTIQSLFEAYPSSLIGHDAYCHWLSPDNDEVDRAALLFTKLQRAPILEKNKRREETIDWDKVNAVHLNAEGELAARVLAMMARTNLEAERDFYLELSSDFVYVGKEVEVSGLWRINPKLAVNFYMSIDRVDRTSAEALRFVDFKTGNENLGVESIETMLSEDASHTDGLFQLLTYSEAYQSIKETDVSIMPMLHPMRLLSNGGKLRPLTVAKKKVEDYNDVKGIFAPRLYAFIERIFDPEEDFVQCKNKDNCTYCSFRTMCGRMEKKEF